MNNQKKNNDHKDWINDNLFRNVLKNKNFISICEYA